MLFSDDILAAIDEIISSITTDNIILLWEEKKFKPQIVDVVPKNLLEVVYNEKDGSKLASKLELKDTEAQPILKFLQAKDDKLYTLVMVDFDAKLGEQKVQWAVINIKGQDLKKGTASPDGNVVFKYKAPEIGKSEEKHFVFHLYEQPSEADETSVEIREPFKSKEFIELVGAEKDPAAGNFFTIQKISDSKFFKSKRENNLGLSWLKLSQCWAGKI